MPRKWRERPALAESPRGPSRGSGGGSSGTTIIDVPPHPLMSRSRPPRSPLPPPKPRLPLTPPLPLLAPALRSALRAANPQRSFPAASPPHTGAGAAVDAFVKITNVGTMSPRHPRGGFFLPAGPAAAADGRAAPPPPPDVRVVTATAATTGGAPGAADCPARVRITARSQAGDSAEESNEARDAPEVSPRQHPRDAEWIGGCKGRGNLETVAPHRGRPEMN